MRSTIFSLGGEGAGLPYHSHGAAWLAVVFGAKRWAVWPPNDFPQDVHNMSGLQNSSTYFRLHHKPRRGMLECVQRPGEAVYMPAFWTHATMNLGEVVAVGGQDANIVRPRDKELDAVIHRWPRALYPRILKAYRLGIAKQYQAAIAQRHAALAVYPFDMSIREGIAEDLLRINDRKGAECIIVDGCRLVQRAFKTNVGLHHYY